MWIDEILPETLRSSAEERLTILEPYLKFEERLLESFPGVAKDMDDYGEQSQWDSEILPGLLLKAASRMFRFCAGHVFKRTKEGRMAWREHDAYLTRLRNAILLELPVLFRKYRCEEAYLRSLPSNSKADLRFQEFTAELGRTVDREYRNCLTNFMEELARAEDSKGQLKATAIRIDDKAVQDGPRNARLPEAESPTKRLIKTIREAQQLMASVPSSPFAQAIETLRNALGEDWSADGRFIAAEVGIVPAGPLSLEEPTEAAGPKATLGQTRRAAIDAYIKEVMEKTGKVLTRSDIWREAKYTHRRQFEGWQRGEAKPGTSVDRNISRVLKSKPHLALNR
jgi:hypothetical protein